MRNNSVQLRTSAVWRRLVGLGALVGLSASTGGACALPVSPTELVTQNIHVLTSDGRDLGTVPFVADARKTMSLTVRDLQAKGVNISDTDAKFFALREQNQNGRVGSFVANASRGALTFPPFANTRVLWLMNATHHVDYGCAWDTGFGSRGIIDHRYGNVGRLTPQNNDSIMTVVDGGDTAGIEAGLALLNRAWLVNGIAYAELTWIGDAATADIKAGFGGYPLLPGAAGLHIFGHFVISPTLDPPVFEKTRGATVEEAFETYSRNADDICGQDSWHSLFVHYVDPDLSPGGKDYVRFGVLMSR